MAQCSQQALHYPTPAAAFLVPLSVGFGTQACIDWLVGLDFAASESPHVLYTVSWTDFCACADSEGALLPAA